MNKVNSFKELETYQAAFSLQQALFQASQRWPKQEDYSLTDQARRASRSVGANLAEAWAKRRYPAHFLSKLTDADGELQETMHWVDSAFACKYLEAAEDHDLLQRAAEVGRLLGGMIIRHESFCY